MSRLPLVVVVMAGVAAALPEATQFNVVKDVCPESVSHWEHYKGKFDTVDSCEVACEKEAGCTMFTWNHAQSPKQCWGYAESKPEWAVNKNPHCTSGCASSVAHCGDKPAPSPPPGPPAPLPPGAPHCVGAGCGASVKTNASAGLRPIPGVEHITVYNATVNGDRNPFGVYGHGPMISWYRGLYYMSWYNAPVGEMYNKRSVYATSADARSWSAPAVLFPTFTQQQEPGVTNERGEENGPWTILNGRLYTQSGTVDAGEHHEGILSVMRRVGVDGNASALGPPFWLNSSVPAYCKSSKSPDCGYPTYLQMDKETRGDAAQLLASFVRTTVRSPDLAATDDDDDHTPAVVATGAGNFAKPPPPAKNWPTMKYNERSVYKIPGTRTLALLLRGGGHNLSVAMCDLPAPSKGLAADETLFSCRPGVGDAFMNLVEVVAAPTNGSSAEPRVCNWTAPVKTSLPDSGSRTCAGTFPPLREGGGLHGVYMVGNQIDKGRDPVTLSLSQDGRAFDQHWAVRFGVPGADIDHGGSCPRYPGTAKGCGYQYPGAMIDVPNGRMLVSYSIGKEDIGLTIFPLSSLQQQLLQMV